jgi:hypothetical protein
MKRGVEACALLMIIPERVSLLRSIALLVRISTGIQYLEQQVG